MWKRQFVVIACSLLMLALLSPICHSEREVEEEQGRNYFFVQFNECPTEQMLEEIKGLDGIIHQYYHTYRYLVNIDAAEIDTVTSLPFVSDVEPYRPVHKHAGDITELTGIVKLRVGLHDGVDVVAVSDHLKGLGIEIDLVNSVGVLLILCTADSSVIADILSLKEVFWVEQLFESQTFMNLITSNPYLGHDTPHVGGFAGNGILAEVQDDGIDLDHPDLLNVIWTDGGVGSSNHGTCTSGIMFGTGAGNIDAQGILYEAVGAFCSLFVNNYVSISNLWNGNFNEGSTMLNGVVQTNSWYSGGPMDGRYGSVSNEIDRAGADFPKVLSHWACGNSNQGSAEGLMSRESVAKNAISVGAIFHHDTADMSDDEWHIEIPGECASRGPARDGRVKPDMCGMFDWILTTDEEPGGYVGGEYYDDFGGTSGACPNIAGSSGLTYDMYIDNYFDNNPGGSIPYSSTIKALMIADAQQYPLETGGNQITRNVQGWGTPDMENMYNLGADYHVIEEYPQALGSGGVWSRTIYVDGTQPLKTTLCWIDPAAPSGTGAGRALINNLDLTLISPSGTEFYGNLGLGANLWSTSGIGVNHWSLSSGSRDDLNNVENVFVALPLSGQWTVQVSGRPGDMPIPDGPQHFSLVASGAKQGWPPTVTVDVPNGGEDWTVGTFHDIEWTMSDTYDPATDLLVTIDYSIDSGFTFPYNIITNQNGFGGSASYNWDVPNTPTTNAIVRVTVENTKGSSTNDESNSIFTISVVDPQVQVLSPNGGESLLGDGSWDIQWTATAGTNPLIASPITIEYSSTGLGGPWIPIASNENNDGIYTWTPIPVINSVNCYVRITAEDTFGYSGDDASNSSFEIDSTAPLLATNVHAELTGVNDVTIYWDASPSSDVDYYEVWFIQNGWDKSGDSYSLAGSVPAGTSSYVHANRGVNNGNYYAYQVRAFDDAGHETRTYTQAAKFGRTLLIAQSEWWLLSSCVVQSNTSLDHVIQGEGMPGAWDYALAWDTTTGRWISHLDGRPPLLNDLTDITNDMGFWLHTTGNARFTTAGYVANMTINLNAGWNLVGYPTLNNTETVGNALWGTGADKVMVCDMSEPYHIKEAGPTYIMKPGEGYWVHVPADTVWVVDW